MFLVIMIKPQEFKSIGVISIFLLSVLSGVTSLSSPTDLLVFDAGTETMEWLQMIGEDDGSYSGGFGTPSNLATRGIAIYEEEVYVLFRGVE